MLARNRDDDNPGKRSVELLPAYFDFAAGGIVQMNPLSLEAIQHHKMVHVPMNDAGKFALFANAFRTHAEGFHFKAVMFGCYIDVFRLGAVA